jgi:hypothetical protein
VVTPARLVAAGIALALFAAGAALVVKRGDGDGDVPVLRNGLLATSSRIDPQTHLFGQRVHARLEVVYDADRVERGSLAIAPGFGAYHVVERHESRASFGHVDRVRFEWALECLTARCLPRKDGVVQFRPTRLQYEQRALPAPQTATVEWPQLRVAARVGPADLKAVELQADARDLPPVSYGVEPKTVALVGYTLAGLLSLAGLLLLLRALDFRAQLARALAGRQDRLSALQRALALVRGHTTRGEHDRSRPALERLAGELRRTREPDLAFDASRLAWRRSNPSDTTISPLSDEVERVIARDEQ